MPTVSKICPEHLSRRAYIYVRQSSLGQVLNHPESASRQRDLVKLAAGLGWSPSQIIVVDEDEGKSATTSNGREAFKRIVGDVSVGEAGIVIGLEIARLARWRLLPPDRDVCFDADLNCGRGGSVQPQ